ncbi:MAG: sigma-70 family RNA polymerase sigma factor [Bacteroidota bacterium]
MQQAQTLKKQNDFLAAYSPCEAAFVRYCSALTFGKMNTDDLVQEVLASAFEHFDRIRHKDKLLHYLVRSARFTYIDQLRRDKFKAELLDQHTRELATQGASPETILDAQLVFEAMDQLPSEQAEALLQFEVLGFPIKEIAKNQQSLAGAVKTRISRGRKKVRDLLEDRDRPNALLLLGTFPFSFSQREPKEMLTSSTSVSLSSATINQIFSSPSLSLTNWITVLTAAVLCIGLILGLAGGISLPSSEATHRPKVCVLTGKINGKYTEGLMIHKASENPRTGQLILVEDSSFHYEFSYEQAEAYQLIFMDEYITSGWRAITFFPTDGEIQFSLYPREQYDMNRVLGGALNREYQSFLSTYQQPFLEYVDHLSDEHKALRKRLKAMKDSVDRTLEAKIQALKSEIDSTNLAFSRARTTYIRNHQSIVSYYLLYEDAAWLASSEIDLETLTDNFQLLTQRFPSHPYNELIAHTLNSYKSVGVGSTFVNFSAPELDGTDRELSQLIEGKVALLDLWASWCKPCILKSRSILPLYEEFKDQGFTVVGVAREYKNTQALERRLDLEQYPWVNLVEVNDQTNLWVKYDLFHSAGATFLIDREGTIVAVDPTAAQVRELLQQLL